jgi:outer membrane receptor protein involved in Fe transport
LKDNGFYQIPAYNYLDLLATYTFRDGLRLTMGVNNILDTDPPLLFEVYSETGFHSMYKPLGLTVYKNLQFEF